EPGRGRQGRDRPSGSGCLERGEEGGDGDGHPEQAVGDPHGTELEQFDTDEPVHRMASFSAGFPVSWRKMSSRSAVSAVVSKMGMAASAARVPMSSPEAPVTSSRSGP